MVAGYINYSPLSFFAGENNMTTEEIFTGISTHMIIGVMIHKELADYYDFMSLAKYEKIQSKQYISESKSLRKLNRYFITRFSKLIPESRFEIPSVIPKDIYKHKSDDLSPMDVRQAVKRTLEMWVDWETKTKKLYEESYAELISNGDIGSALYISELIKDVDEELVEAKTLLMKNQHTDFDVVKIIEDQD